MVGADLFGWLSQKAKAGRRKLDQKKRSIENPNSRANESERLCYHDVSGEKRNLRPRVPHASNENWRKLKLRTSEFQIV